MRCAAASLAHVVWGCDVLPQRSGGVRLPASGEGRLACVVGEGGEARVSRPARLVERRGGAALAIDERAVNIWRARLLQDQPQAAETGRVVGGGAHGQSGEGVARRIHVRRAQLNEEARIVARRPTRLEGGGRCGRRDGCARGWGWHGRRGRWWRGCDGEAPFRPFNPIGRGFRPEVDAPVNGPSPSHEGPRRRGNVGLARQCCHD